MMENVSQGVELFYDEIEEGGRFDTRRYGRDLDKKFTAE